MKRENGGFLLMEVLIAAVLLSVFSSVAFRGFLAGRRMEKDAAMEERLLLAAKQKMEEVKKRDLSSLAAEAETKEGGIIRLRQPLGEGYVMETTLDPFPYRKEETEAAVFRRNAIGEPRLLEVETPENFVLTPENFESLEEGELIIRITERGKWLILDISSEISGEAEEPETEEIYSGRRRICLEENGTRMENRGYLFFPDEALPEEIYVEGRPRHEMELYLIFGEEEPGADCLCLNGFPVGTEKKETLRVYTNLDGGLPVAEEPAGDCLYQITVAVYKAGEEQKETVGCVEKEVLTLHGIREER